MKEKDKSTERYLILNSDSILAMEDTNAEETLRRLRDGAKKDLKPRNTTGGGSNA